MRTILLANLCWLLVLADDFGCLFLGGTCQEDTLNCSGNCVSRLCSGHASRRCCCTDYISCSDVKIVSRSDWGAVPPKAVSYLNPPVQLVFIHNTETPACNDLKSCSQRLRDIQYFHMNVRGWDDIGYSFLIGEDGNAYEGRGWDRVGSHTKGYNDRSLGFAFIGNYANHLPPAIALSAAENLIKCGIEHRKITSDYCMYGHRDVKDTTCPGEALYREIQTWPHYNCTDSTFLYMSKTGTQKLIRMIVS